jgi:hypothetical protein
MASNLQNKRDETEYGWLVLRLGDDADLLASPPATGIRMENPLRNPRRKSNKTGP